MPSRLHDSIFMRALDAAHQQVLNELSSSTSLGGLTDLSSNRHLDGIEGATAQGAL